MKFTHMLSIKIGSSPHSNYQMYGNAIVKTQYNKFSVPQFEKKYSKEIKIYAVFMVANR